MLSRTTQTRPHPATRSRPESVSSCSCNVRSEAKGSAVWVDGDEANRSRGGELSGAQRNRVGWLGLVDLAPELRQTLGMRSPFDYEKITTETSNED